MKVTVFLQRCFETQLFGKLDLNIFFRQNRHDFLLIHNICSCEIFKKSDFAECRCCQSKNDVILASNLNAVVDICFVSDPRSKFQLLNNDLIICLLRF